MLAELKDQALMDSSRNNHQEVKSTRPLDMAPKIQCPTFAEHFNKLSQLDSLEECIDSFKELRAILLQNGY